MKFQKVIFVFLIAKAGTKPAFAQSRAKNNIVNFEALPAGNSYGDGLIGADVSLIDSCNAF